MSEIHPESPKQHENDNKTTTKRTPSKRKSPLEKAQAESEELIKNMGVIVETDGRRRTRSSVKGTPTPCTPPPPAKKQKVSMSTTPSRRGRPRKNEFSDEKLEEEEVDNNATPMETEENENKIENKIIKVDTQINNIVEKGFKNEISNAIDEKKIESNVEEPNNVDCQQVSNKNDSIADETIIKENDCEKQKPAETVPGSKDTKIGTTKSVNDNELENIEKSNEKLESNNSEVKNSVVYEKKQTIEKIDDISLKKEKEIKPDVDLKVNEKEKLPVSVSNVDIEKTNSLSITTSTVKVETIVDDTSSATSPVKEKIVEEIKKDSTQSCEPKIAIDETGSDEYVKA